MACSLQDLARFTRCSRVRLIGEVNSCIQLTVMRRHKMGFLCPLTREVKRCVCPPQIWTTSKKKQDIFFMPYNGGTPPHLVATIPSTLLLTCLNQDSTKLST